MSDRLNESQRRLAETTEGMVCVDAGPGTGKTHTIVSRYINIISRRDVNPTDVLLLTFTRNAAAEMDQRIKEVMTADIQDGDGNWTENPLKKDVKLVQTKTFDAFCTSVVMDSPEQVGEFFGIKERLTRGATLCENETLNKDYFRGFFDRYLMEVRESGLDYGDWPVIASQYPLDLMKLIDRLMSKGIYPLKRGWFGLDSERTMVGDTDALIRDMRALNVSPKEGKPSKLRKALDGCDVNDFGPLPSQLPGDEVDDSIISMAAYEDRTDLFRFIHDVYHAYIRRSIMDNRLTFGLNAMFAFTLLYSDRSVRSRNSYRYVMIDEFQDTNANQLMIALMILSEPNLCVVGDWKQGIYGFRFVSIENIVHFEERMVALRRYLNDDGTERISFSIPTPEKLSLDLNYRSSQDIVDTSFECMFLPGTEKDVVDVEAVERNLVRLTAARKDIGDRTAIRYVSVDSNEEETGAVVQAIWDYVGSDAYAITSDEGSRRVSYGDIAVICRKTSSCRSVLEACQLAGVPAYLQGEIEIMSTREGKLALAWLRYVNNDFDQWGYVTIMADMGYSLADIYAAKDDSSKVPSDIREWRRTLYEHRRRITELLTMIYSHYGLDNDITQAIIATISKAHRDSLLTISDVIGIIEEDIASGTTYTVENSIDRDAVSIMTMHKSKGLQFPVVIIPFVDQKIMPSNPSNRVTFLYDPVLGIRCTQVVGRFDGYSKICRSWSTLLVSKTRTTDYDEERRLMFVAVSRAKQYVTVLSGPNPSQFMKGLSGGDYESIPFSEGAPVDSEEALSEPPDVSGYTRRRLKLGVHDVMSFEGDNSGMYQMAGEACGKGMEYGTQVHFMANKMAMGMPLTQRESEFPERSNVQAVLDRVRGADIIQTEIDCGLPLEGADITLRGIIDLLAVFPDRIEVHDYKTDESSMFEDEYRLQLSIYARAAEGHYGRLARCFIDYVSRGCTTEFEPMTVSEITERVLARIDNSQTREAEGNPNQL